MRQVIALGAILLIGFLLVLMVNVHLPPFGTFPDRRLGSFENESIGQRILEDAPGQTGASNVVTSVVWGYRGYDTLGEVTVLFTAVVGVVMLFFAFRRQE